ncbi:IS4 family transposase, partial [Bacillus cereus]
QSFTRQTSFRELKYALGLSAFHSKKKEFIHQEIYARLIMYNFSMLISLKVTVDKGKKEYLYQINFTRSFSICRQFFKRSSIDVESLIHKYILPIRSGRKDIRNLNVKGFNGFLYRVA